MNNDFERFSIYGFSIDYPKDCRLEFNPKSRRDTGDVVFHFPDRMKVFLSWGDLEKAAKNFQTVEQHAEHSLKNIKKSGAVKNFERISQDSVTIHSHRGAYNRVKLEEIAVGFLSGKRTVPRESYSVHVHCPNTARYFVVYTMIPGSSNENYEKTVMTMANSLKCHK